MSPEDAMIAQEERAVLEQVIKSLTKSQRTTATQLLNGKPVSQQAKTQLRMALEKGLGGRGRCYEVMECLHV